MSGGVAGGVIAAERGPGGDTVDMGAFGPAARGGGGGGGGAPPLKDD